MMPRGPGKLTLSHMNFGGIGPKLMKRAMRQQNVSSIEELMATAREQGVKMIACTMSMDVMGLKPGELIDGWNSLESLLISVLRTRPMSTFSFSVTANANRPAGARSGLEA